MSRVSAHEPQRDLDQRILVEALERAGAAIAVLRLSSLRFVYANRAFSEFARGAPILGRHYTELFPTALALGQSVLPGLLAGRTPLRMEDVWVPIPSLQTEEPGSYATVEVSTFKVGAVSYLLVTARETTARVLQQQSLEQARARETERLSFSQTLEAINEIIHSSLDYDEIMGMALEQGTVALGAQAGALFTEVEPGVSEARYAFGLPSAFVGRRFPGAAFPFSAQLRETRRPISIGSKAMGSLMNPMLAKMFRVRSLLVIPVVVRGELTGGIGIIYRRPHEFSASELDFAAAFGASLSLALQNADSFRRERNVASTLQHAQLTVLNSVEGFEVAHSYRGATDALLVGGDFYDIFETNEDLIGITIGDISGKGLDAAVMTSLVKNSVRAQATASAQSVADVVSAVNHILYSDSPADSFATLFFATLSRSSGSLTYCNAGHTTGFVLRSGGAVERLPSTSTIVGAFERVDFTHAEARLERGDGIFLYTDGVTEARRGAEFFGEERLAELLRKTGVRSVERVCKTVMEAVVEFSGGRMADDVAILVLRRT